MSKKKKITILKVKAKHISAVDQGNIQTLIVVNSCNISPMEVGTIFNSVELTDHGVTHTMNRRVMVLSNVFQSYYQKGTVKDVSHITLCKLP